MSTWPTEPTLRAVALLESAHDPDGPLWAEARWCLAERRRPPSLKGLPKALGDALEAERARVAADVLARADAALWAAARRCSAGWELNVGWQRIDRELTEAERRAVCVSGRKGRKLQTAWSDARRRGPG